MCLASWETWDINGYHDMTRDGYDGHEIWTTFPGSVTPTVKSNPSSTRRWNLATSCRLVHPPKRWAILIYLRPENPYSHDILSIDALNIDIWEVLVGDISLRHMNPSRWLDAKLVWHLGQE